MSREAASFRFHCPACGKALTSSGDAIGKRARCPHCKISITVPQLPANGGTVNADAVELAAAAVETGEPPAWRSVVQNHREFVPLIECSAGVGSGLLVSRDGLVVTNRHVIAQAQVFMLTFYDGSKAKAVAVHTHGHRDLAVVRAAIRRDQCFDIEKRVCPEVQSGDDVLAIGHPRGFAFTSTRGIISETRRRLADGEYLQSDVAINPGNSGGPLLDQFGRLVGLNTRILAESQGLGFAIAGVEVQAYVLYVMDLLKRRELRLPSDEEIAKAVQILSPWDIACAAVAATGLQHRRNTLNGGRPCLTVRTVGGKTFTVAVGGNLFRVGGHIATGLTDKQLRDPKLLLRLLGWQHELCGPGFEVTGNNLVLGFKRNVEGLDVNEAREAILRVADALDALHDAIREHLK